MRGINRLLALCLLVLLTACIGARAPNAVPTAKPFAPANNDLLASLASNVNIVSIPCSNEEDFIGVVPGISESYGYLNAFQMYTDFPKGEPAAPAILNGERVMMLWDTRKAQTGCYKVEGLNFPIPIFVRVKVQRRPGS